MGKGLHLRIEHSSGTCLVQWPKALRCAVWDTSGGWEAGYTSVHVWTTRGMGKTQLSFCVTSCIDDDIDAMAYPSLKTPVSKVKKGRGKDWISSLPLGGGDGGQG